MSASPIVTPPLNYRHLLDEVHALHEGELQDLRAQIAALQVERARLAQILVDRDTIARRVDRDLDKATTYLIANNFTCAQQHIAWAQAGNAESCERGRAYRTDAPLTGTGNIVSLAAARAGRS